MRWIRIKLAALLAWMYERVNPPMLPAEQRASVRATEEMRAAAHGMSPSPQAALRDIWQASERSAIDPMLPEAERAFWRRQAVRDREAYVKAGGGDAIH